MFSFLTTRAGSGVVLKYTRSSEVSVIFSSSDCSSKNESSQTEFPNPAQSHPLYKRDLINFPRPSRLDRNPPVRFGFIPKAWFDFFYKKTGVTGGYMLLFGSVVALFSKEIIVVNPETIQAFGYITYVTMIHKLYGRSIYNYVEGLQEKSDQELELSQERAKDDIRNEMKELEKSLWQNEGIAKFLPEAKRENVYLQMETEYRQRLKAQYMAVKNVLDYQVAKSNIERSLFQKALYSWVVDSVYQSLTPEIKQNFLTKSIQDLNDLASRSAV